MACKKERPPWFQMDPAEFLTDSLVSAMNAVEFGATMRLLLRQWLDGHITDNLAMLARQCKLTLPEMEAAWPMLSEFFPELEPGKRANRFMAAQRGVVMARFERQTAFGKKGVEARRRKKDEANSNESGVGEQAPSTYPEGTLKAPLTVPQDPPQQDLRLKTKDKVQVQKPSRAKAARATKSAVADERHTVFKGAIKTYWDAKNPGVEMPWGAMEGKQLGMWLREAPHITLDQFTGFLRARFKSDVNHSERPSQWIRWVTSYASGPIDRFGKPLISGENGNGTNKPSVTSQRVADNRAAINKASKLFGWANPDGADSANGRSLPEPRPDGLAGGVLVGFPATGPEILPPESHSGPGGTQAQTGAELLSSAR